MCSPVVKVPGRYRRSARTTTTMITMTTIVPMPIYTECLISFGWQDLPTAHRNPAQTRHPRGCGWRAGRAKRREDHRDQPRPMLPSVGPGA
jgi:hypothetical protein